MRRVIEAGPHNDAYLWSLHVSDVGESRIYVIIPIRFKETIHGRRAIALCSLIHSTSTSPRDTLEAYKISLKALTRGLYNIINENAHPIHRPSHTLPYPVPPFSTIRHPLPIDTLISSHPRSCPVKAAFRIRITSTSSERCIDPYIGI